MAKRVYEGVTFGDVHFGATDPKRLYRELREGVYAYVEANATRLGFVVVKGDYLDRKLAMNSEDCRLATRFMFEMLTLCEANGIKLRVIRGTSSHDLSQLDNFKHLEAEAPGFRVINSAEYEELLPAFHVLWVPEEYPEDWRQYYAPFFSALEGEKFDIAFGHGTFEFEAFKNQVTESERPVKSAPVFSEKEFLGYVRYADFGHVHRASSYKGRIFYSGSYSRWAFGEEGTKGFFHVSYDPDECKASFEFIANPLAPEYRTVHVGDLRAEHGDDAAVAEAIRVIKRGCHRLRVLVDGEAGEDTSASILREHFSEADGVVVKVRRGAGPAREDDGDYAHVFAEGEGVVQTARRFIALRAGRQYTDDQVVACITLSIGEDNSD